VAASQKAGVQSAGKQNVVDKAPGADEQRSVFKPWNGFPDH
jgi:hypothetical protein